MTTPTPREALTAGVPLSAHKDDSYGQCVVCRVWDPTSGDGDDEILYTVSFPCAFAARAPGDGLREAAMRYFDARDSLDMAQAAKDCRRILGIPERFSERTR